MRATGWESLYEIVTTATVDRSLGIRRTRHVRSHPTSFIYLPFYLTLTYILFIVQRVIPDILVVIGSWFDWNFKQEMSHWRELIPAVASSRNRNNWRISMCIVIASTQYPTAYAKMILSSHKLTLFFIIKLMVF